jgi:hypothetical protein
MTNVTNRYRTTEAYDIFKDGSGVRVMDKKTGRIGTVQYIRETSYECLDPFVQFDGSETIERSSTYSLMKVVADETI